MARKKFIVLALSALSALFNGGCSKKIAPRAVKEIELPRHVLKDPSSLAYDGENFYIADWKSPGLLKVDPGGRIEALAFLPANSKSQTGPIQAAAVSRGRLLVETNDGRLYLSETAGASGNPAPREVWHEFERKPGSLFCWDGIYVWMIEQGTAFPTVLLPDNRLARMPGREKNTPPEGLALACGWETSAVLYSEGEDMMLADNIFKAGDMKIHPWTENDLEPLAIAAAGRGRLAVKKKKKAKEGNFKIVYRQTTPASRESP
ncbi:MAG: hypothetical protein HY747_08555 [Elusimicrobia bacterium]|nr:hypothetical protein [Elusimicrobiota bacterium]